MDDSTEQIAKKWLDDYAEQILGVAVECDLAATKVQEWEEMRVAGSISDHDCRERQRHWASKYLDSRRELDRLKEIAVKLRTVGENLETMKKAGISIGGTIGSDF